MQKPECTSLNAGCTPPVAYCKECSHAVYYGEVIVKGRTHRFEFAPRFGFTFLNVDGSERKVQPGEKNPVWDALKKWEEENLCERLMAHSGTP